ncbi:hypothetical protein NQZ68_021052 [Dissostichus eleginoides]|nr:hypothetical protein NQZ68_021052 [Dissostichus eleginoides]
MQTGRSEKTGAVPLTLGMVQRRGELAEHWQGSEIVQTMAAIFLAQTEGSSAHLVHSWRQRGGCGGVVGQREVTVRRAGQEWRINGSASFRQTPGSLLITAQKRTLSLLLVAHVFVASLLLSGLSCRSQRGSHTAMQ